MITAPTYKGKRVGVFGLARTGVAAVEALTASGADGYAWDDMPERRVGIGEALHDLYAEDLATLDALMLAPGVPLTHPEPHVLALAARNNGVPIISDFDVFEAARASLPAHNTVAITGTNGKSTTTALINHMIMVADKPVAMGGNIGTGILSMDALDEGGSYVFEVSSFQLDLTRDFKADIAVLLNVTPDHLDRHGSMQGYVRAKQRLFEMQARESATAIISVDDEYCRDVLSRAHAHVISISVEHVLETGVYAIDGVLFDAMGDAPIAVLTLADCPTLSGKHNAQNVAAAYAVGRTLGLSVDTIVSAMQTFPGLAHRQEVVANIDGIRFINDSKATNVDAASRALHSFENIHWIAGGRSKDGIVEPIIPDMMHVKHTYLIGEAADAFAEQLKSTGPVTLSGTLDAAVHTAFAQANAGDVILLSPACASFDQFASFEARGEAFKDLVENLAQTQEAGS